VEITDKMKEPKLSTVFTSEQCYHYIDNPNIKHERSELARSLFRYFGVKSKTFRFEIKIIDTEKEKKKKIIKRIENCLKAEFDDNPAAIERLFDNLKDELLAAFDVEEE
jgi:hypothetical protein